MDGRLLRKRYGRRIAALASTLSIGILLMGSVLLYLSSGVLHAWKEYSSVSETRSSTLSELHRAIGYGGFIHNFKNYVLRKDTALLQELGEDLEQSSRVINKYSDLDLNAEELSALSVISGTLSQYKENVEVATEAIHRGESPTEIDRYVRVDDQPALAAFGIMQQQNKQYAESVGQVMHERINQLMNTLLIGLLAMPFVVLAAFHYHRVMNRFIALMIEKRQVERVLEDTAAEVAQVQEKHLAMAYEAHHCELTRVPNRKAFMKKGQQILDDVASKSECLIVLFVDVDDFKAINDNFGHEVGDLVLVEVANRLTVALREGDFVARIGGDEFAMIVQCPESGANSQRLAERLLDVMNQSYDHLTEGLSVSCSVGGAVFPDEGEDLAALIRVADERMYRVKKSGKNGVFLHED